MTTAEDFVQDQAAAIAARAERELEALVAVSSPSGDGKGAEEAFAVCSALLPGAAEIDRIPCSSPGHAPDLVARLEGHGAPRLLLLGHVDTVIPHREHRPLRRDNGRLAGSGAVDMKGGVVLALGVMRALEPHREAFAEAALLLVCDEEWRTQPFIHAERFAGWDACLCFEAGERTPQETEAVVVRRKAAGTLWVRASGQASHSGSAPARGRNALLALTAAAEAVAARNDPDGPLRLTAVPTVLKSGEAFNVVPAAGELFCDLRADSGEVFDDVAAAVPAEVGGATLTAELTRRWPGMDSREPTAGLLERAGKRLGRPVAAVERGGASDASHLATTVPVTVDGLGPRGGGAHTPGEFVRADALHSRSEVALALTAALLGL